jgi:hypothetical protein
MQNLPSRNLDNLIQASEVRHTLEGKYAANGGSGIFGFSSPLAEHSATVTSRE